LPGFGVSLTGQGQQTSEPGLWTLLAAKKPVSVPRFQPTAAVAGGNRPGGAGGGATGSTALPTTPPSAPLQRRPRTNTKDSSRAGEGRARASGDRLLLQRRHGARRLDARPERRPSANRVIRVVRERARRSRRIITKPAPLLRAPLAVKTPNISNAERPADPAVYVDSISKQLNAGVSIINFVEVDSVDEVTKGINAMRFASKGGTRPDAIGDAAKYWGVDEKTYRAKADVWPLDPNGNLLAWAIIETKEGIANVREIAQVKGLSAVIVGAGTLGGVFSTTNAEGRACVTMRRGKRRFRRFWPRARNSRSRAATPPTRRTSKRA
jgi:hypothetical protein